MDNLEKAIEKWENRELSFSDTSDLLYALIDIRKKEFGVNPRKYYRIINRLFTLSEELNGKDWEPDWKNVSDGIYYVYWDHREGDLQYGEVGANYCDIKGDAFLPYFKNETLVCEAIEILRRELKQ